MCVAPLDNVCRSQSFAQDSAPQKKVSPAGAPVPVSPHRSHSDLQDGHQQGRQGGGGKNCFNEICGVRETSVR